LRAVLGAKPTGVLGGDAMCDAVARRAGARRVADLDEWLAHAAMLDAGIAPDRPVTIVVMGGGRAYVEAEARAASLDAEVVAVDDRAPEAARAHAARADAEGRGVVVVTGSPAPSAESLTTDGAAPLLVCDLRQPSQLKALITALARAAAPAPASGSARGRVDRALVERVREESESTLGDHDSKRLLKAYGVRVTRQAPANTPTGAVKLARAIGLPVSLVGPQGARQATTLPDVKRITGLLLAEDLPPSKAGDAPRLLMVREVFPDVPRARIEVTHDPNLGAVMKIGETCALLPLERSDAQVLAQATHARRATVERAVADLLQRISACAVDEKATFELEIFVGPEPVITEASGRLL
jgi:hypothetical protein